MQKKLRREVDGDENENSNMDLSYLEKKPMLHSTKQLGPQEIISGDGEVWIVRVYRRGVQLETGWWRAAWGESSGESDP